jgi:hypothetical protein
MEMTNAYLLQSHAYNADSLDWKLQWLDEDRGVSLKNNGSEIFTSNLLAQYARLNVLHTSDTLHSTKMSDRGRQQGDRTERRTDSR